MIQFSTNTESLIWAFYLASFTEIPVYASIVAAIASNIIAAMLGYVNFVISCREQKHLL